MPPRAPLADSHSHTTLGNSAQTRHRVRLTVQRVRSSSSLKLMVYPCRHARVPITAENALESIYSAHTGTLARGHDDKPNWSRTLVIRHNRWYYSYCGVVFTPLSADPRAKNTQDEDRVG